MSWIKEVFAALFAPATQRPAAYTPAPSVQPRVIEQLVVEVRTDIDFTGLAEMERRVAALHADWSSLAVIGAQAEVVCGALVSTMRVCPGDVLVVTSPRLLSAEQRINLREQILSYLPAWPDQGVLIMDGGLTLGLISPVDVAAGAEVRA